MRAEVGLLSRNVVIKGSDPVDHDDDYGAHFIIHGDNTRCRIEDAEFKYMGQPRYPRRNSIEFEYILNMNESYFRSNSLHSSFARFIALNEVSYLTISNNVALDTRGISIYLNTGAEKHNIIEHNLIIAPRKSLYMLNYDRTPAGIWVRNPQNIIRFNHVVGSEYYGIHFDIPSKTSTYSPHECP